MLIDSVSRLGDKSKIMIDSVLGGREEIDNNYRFRLGGGGDVWGWGVHGPRV